MARTSNKQTGKRPSATKRPVNKGTRGGSKAKPSYNKAKAADKAPLLDDRTQRDIVGVVLVVAAVALFVCTIITPNGVVTTFVNQGLFMLVGIGAYLLPLLLLGIAVAVLVRTEAERVTARTSVGLGLLFVAVLGLSSLFCPGADTSTYVVFQADNLASHGGFVGSGLAWVMLSLFGQVIGAIVLVGMVIVSLIIVGVSLRGPIERMREKMDQRAAEREAAGFEEEPVAAPGTQMKLPFPRIRRGDRRASELEAAPTQVLGAEEVPADVSAAPTRVLGGKKRAASRRNEALDTPVNPDPTMTMMFGDEPAVERPMTRKLKSRRPVEDEQPLAKPEEPKKSSRPKTPVATPKRQDGFELPDPKLLNVSAPTSKTRANDAVLAETAELLGETLAEFGIAATVVDWVSGPTVTLFKVDLPAGVRVSRVTALTDDIALALASPGVRIFAPVPGTNYVGIEVPNREHQTVLLGDVIKGAPAGPLQVAIGKDVEGNTIVSDLAKMPHLLIGGTTGSGKSVAINSMIMSILMRATPSEVRLIMIDPKRVEFTPYNGIPHLYVPVVTECKEAASALSWAVAEMERRLKEFSKLGVRNIGQYNAKIQAANMDVENEEDKQDEEPYIVVIIDELADLMMNVGKEVEFSIARLAQLARAAGIHLIVATQRPSANVVTGLIKANITNRMAFNVASGVDSRVILDQVGAENLIGHGDLLLSKPEYAKPVRIQGCFVSEEETEAVVEHLKQQGEPDYHNDILQTNVIRMGDTQTDGSGGCAGGPDDPLVWEAADIVVSSGLGSTSNLQRRLSVGYARAGRIMDLLEEKGVVGPANGSRPREVLLDPLDLEGLKALEMND